MPTEMRKPKEYWLRCANCKSETPVHKLKKEDFQKLDPEKGLSGNPKGAFSVNFSHIECGECKPRKGGVSLEITDLNKRELGHLKAFMAHNFTPEEVAGNPALKAIYDYAVNVELADKYIPKPK